MKETADYSLRRALKCLQHDWVHDFVFHNQDQLLYQSLTQNVHLLGEYTIQTQSELPVASVTDVYERGAMLFVCTDTRGALTTGFEVVHRKQTASKVLLHDHYITRIVRDDETGILLSIAQLPGLPLIEVSYCALITPGFRENAFILFRSDEFREMINKYPDRFDHDAAKRAMVYRFFASEWRDCPKCGSTNSHGCGCLLNLTLKSSKHDVGREIANLSAHGGAFDGIAHISSAFMCPNGEALHSKVCRNRSEVTVLKDEAQRIAMSQWALSTVSERNPVNLMRMCVAGGVGDSSASAFHGQVFDECTSRFSLDLGGSMGGIDEFVGYGARGDLDLTELRVGGILDELERIERGRSPSKRKDRVAICGTDVMGGDVDTTLQNAEYEDTNSSISWLVDRALASDGTGEQYKWTESMYQMFVQGMMQNSGGNVCAPAPMQSGDTNKVDVNSTHAHVAAPGALGDGANGTESVQRGKVTGRRRGARATAVRIAPAKSVESCESERVDATALKAELRKARNRASAQRSNLKKKLALQKLKQDLSSLSDRERQLRQTERKLRAENLQLRAAISQ